MPQNEARAWWADVQHVRESIERRRGAVADPSAPADASHTGRFARAAAEPPVPRLDELDWPDELSARPGRRFERSPAAAQRSDRTAARGRHRRPDADRPRTRSHAGGDPGATHNRAADDIAPAATDATGGRDSAPPDVDFEHEFMSPPPPPGERRTVRITGRAASAPALPRLVEVERRRPGRRPAERVGPRPDRIALYAVLLGFFLILVAATSAHAAI